MLGKLGLVTHEDLLHFVPRRYEDRRHLDAVERGGGGAGDHGEGKDPFGEGGALGRAASSKSRSARPTLKSSEDLLIARWYGFRPYGIKEGGDVFLFGKVSRDKKGRWMMSNPEYEIAHEDAESYIHIDRIAPIYNLTEGLTQRVLRRIMFEATQKVAFSAPEFYPAPARMMPRQEAFRMIHFPESFPAEERARQRLAYDEFFVLQCVVALRRHDRGHGHRQRRPAPATAGPRRALAGLAAFHADQRPAARHGRDRRRSAPRPADEPAAPGRCRLGEDVRGASTPCCARSRRASRRR